jgi:hypothetical protein
MLAKTLLHVECILTGRSRIGRFAAYESVFAAPYQEKPISEAYSLTKSLWLLYARSVRMRT